MLQDDQVRGRWQATRSGAKTPLDAKRHTHISENLKRDRVKSGVSLGCHAAIEDNETLNKGAQIRQPRRFSMWLQRHGIGAVTARFPLRGDLDLPALDSRQHRRQTASAIFPAWSYTCTPERGGSRNGAGLIPWDRNAVSYSNTVSRPKSDNMPTGIFSFGANRNETASFMTLPCAFAPETRAFSATHPAKSSANPHNAGVP